MQAHRFMHPASLTVLAALTAVLLAACGGSNKPADSDSSGSSRNAFTAANTDKYPTCMRDHGFPNFPDPTSQGQLTLEMITHAGINLRQPAVLQAGDACVPASDGQITKSDVAQAVANPSAPSASGSQSSTSG